MTNPKLYQIAQLRFFSQYNISGYDGKNEINSLRQPENDVKKWLSQGYIRILDDYLQHGFGVKQNRVYSCTKKLYKALGIEDEYRPVPVKTQQLMHDIMVRDVAMFILRKYPNDRIEFNYKLTLKESAKIVDLLWRHKGTNFLIEVENKQNPSTDTKNKILEFNKVKLPRKHKLLFIVSMLTYDGYARKQTIDNYKSIAYLKEAEEFLKENEQNYSTLRAADKSKVTSYRTFLRRIEGYKRLKSNYDLLLSNIKDLEPVKVSKGVKYHFKYITPIFNFYRLDERVWNIPGLKEKVSIIK